MRQTILTAERLRLICGQVNNPNWMRDNGDKSIRSHAESGMAVMERVIATKLLEWKWSWLLYLK